MTSSLLINDGDRDAIGIGKCARWYSNVHFRGRSNLETERRDLDVNPCLSRNRSSSTDECTNEHRRDRFQRLSRGVWKPRRNPRYLVWL
jgi:hypothetical protein